MHLVKSQEGLGIQITGGRGSRRSPHGIIIAHVEDGGTIQRYHTQTTHALALTMKAQSLLSHG